MQKRVHADFAANQQNKMNIEVLENPNSNPAIQVQLIKAAIWNCVKLISEWKRGPRNNSPAVRAQIAHYSAKLETLQTALEKMVLGIEGV